MVIIAPRGGEAMRVVLFAAMALRLAAQPVYFNHTTIYVSKETYAALKSSPLLRDEFSAFREATIHAEGGAVTYTGLYLNGMHTYLEIFETGPSDISHRVEPPGSIGLGMWVDHLGQLAALRKRLPMMQRGTRKDAQGQPWFDYLNFADPDPGQAGIVHPWVMARYPDGTTRPTTRYQPDRLMHEVAAYALTVGPEDHELLVRDFRAYRYSIAEDGARTIASGPEFTLTMLPEQVGQARTAKIEMTLNREKSGEQSYRFGDSELRFHGDRATFLFRFPRTDHAR
jgi:hypothetical protein